MKIGRKALIALSIGSILTGSCLAAQPGTNLEKFPTEVKTGSVKLKDDSKQEIISQAKITSSEAAAIAKKALPGTVVKTKLDTEDDYLIWGVEVIDSKNQKTKLMIDAGNGHLLAVERDDENDHSSWKFWEDNDKDEHKDRD